MRVLEVATKSCKGGILEWSACMAPEFNETLAVKLLTGKYKRIVAKHNALHATLQSLSQSGHLLDVAPRLQNHDVTSAPIAVAVATLVVA